MTFHSNALHILCVCEKKTGQIYLVYLITLERHVNVCHTQQVILKQFILAVTLDLSFNPVRFQRFLFFFISILNLIGFYSLLLEQLIIGNACSFRPGKLHLSKFLLLFSGSMSIYLFTMVCYG